MTGPRFSFYPRGFENTTHPCLVVDDPQGGDPHILGLFSVLHRPADIIGLVQMANSYLAWAERDQIGKVIGKAEPESTQNLTFSNVQDHGLDRLFETHIERECRLLGCDFAPETGACIHCGAAL